MSRQTELRFLLVIVAVVLLAQALAISRAAVPALDAVRFVNSARYIDEAGLSTFLREHTEPPLFAVSIWTVHSFFNAVFGEFRQSWAVSVQFAAAFPLILLPFPVFWLGKRFVGARCALLGTILVACLPEVIRLGADGISDSTHLLLFSLALFLLVGHFAPAGASVSRVFNGFPAGIATALAALTRTEAALLGAAFAVVLCARWIRRKAFPRWSVAPYAAGVLTILLPYGVLMTIHSAELSAAVNDSGPEPAVSLTTVLAPTGEEAFCFAPKDSTTSIRKRGVGAALGQLADELPKTFAYVPGLLALVGLVILSRRPRTEADLLLQVFCGLFVAAVFFHTTREGYLSARHLLPLAIAATACLGTGADAVGTGFHSLLGPSKTNPRVARRWAFVLTLSVAAVSILYCTRPLHPTRSGHRSAANWLALHASARDRVVDTRGWTGLYSGLTTVPYENAETELVRPELRYLVIEDAELDYDSRRSRTIRKLTEAGRHVATFPPAEKAARRRASVLIYEWNPKRR